MMGTQCTISWQTATYTQLISSVFAYYLGYHTTTPFKTTRQVPHAHAINLHVARLP